MTLGFARFWHTRTEIHPLQVCQVWIWLSKFTSEEWVYFLKFCFMLQPKKVGTVSPLSDAGTTHVTSVKVPCCRLSYIPYVFKRCDLLILKIIILWEAICIKLYSQNPIATFEIKFCVFTHGLWRAGYLEYSVIDWYSQSWWRGGENTPYNIKKGVKAPPWKIANWVWEPWCIYFNL